MPSFTIESISHTGLDESWLESASSFPPEGPAFLEPVRIREAASWTELSVPAIADCLAAASLIERDPGLRKLAWHTHRILFLSGKGRPNTGGWPTDIAGLGRLTGAFYLVTALSGIAGMVAGHRKHGIPESISRLNCRDIHIWARDYKTLGEPTAHGFQHPFDPPRWGLSLRGFAWIVRSLIGEILRVGRLQFIHAPYRSAYRAYRNTQTGIVQVVAEAGHRFTNEGWKAKDDDATAWPSEFTDGDGRVTATPVSPIGRAVRESITLDLDEWTPILAQGDPIVEIHIPEDGPMDFAACGECLEEMIRDFTTYFPDKPFRAFVSGSWLLDPQFQDGMRESSNICRFQRECYLYPIGPGNGRSGFFRLFTSDDIPSLPRDTNMRRTYLDLLESGGKWRGGGMMLFPEDLSWGNQVYLKQHNC